MWPSVAVYALGDLAAYCLSVLSQNLPRASLSSHMTLIYSRRPGAFWISSIRIGGLYV